MLRVSIIDDEVLAINLLEKFLEEINGVEIIGKHTWFEEGLENIKSQKPDLVFLDIDMPGLNGIGVAERIKEIDETIEIIFVTAYDQYALEAFRVHAVDYLLKPTDKNRLKSTIKKIMQRRKVVPDGPDSPLLQGQFIGDFALYDKDANPIKWRTKKVKELCAYLIHHEHPIHRMQIIEDLWPDVPIDKAGTILHTTVYQLRKTLKMNGFSEPLLFVDERYSININIACDYKSIIQIMKQNNFAEEFITSIIDAAEKGYLGFEDYPWSLAQKQKTLEECKRFLDKFIMKNRNRSEKPKIWCNVLEILIELEPFLEPYYRELMKHYIEAGDLKKAIAIYNNLETMLFEELGENPQKETRMLIQKFI